MSRCGLIRVIGMVALMTSSAIAADESLGPLPRVLDDRLKLELFAEHPLLVTPTGIDVDHMDRVWVLESNTHFPPDGYLGHPSDRLLVLQDTDGDGKADKTTVFADGFKFAMSVVVQPVWLDVAGQKEKYAPSLSALPVFVATRGEIVRLRDTNNDLVADERTQLVHLETAGNYPHNGLAGIAFDALGWMYFGFGENLGADYKIIGSDGVTLSGGGEGGNMYRCRPDGSKLEKWATGFWNPHASCFDAFGRLFTVDNDPDSRPPCRLLHIIPGGDYGYRFRNGRRGTHPFTAWNGEIPGTLPMVSGTGEAPSGILCYESDGFPADYLGTLLVGSWGDHRIDQFDLQPKRDDFIIKPKPIVQGGENFRPVGLALAPDGRVYFSDWVLRDYKLHRKGRVWRLSSKEATDHTMSRLHAVIKSSSIDELAKEIEGPSIAIRRLAARKLSQTPEGCDRLQKLQEEYDKSAKISSEIAQAILAVGEQRVGIDILEFDDLHDFLLDDPFDFAEQLRAFSQTFRMQDGVYLREVRGTNPADWTEESKELRRLLALLAARNLWPKDERFAEIGLQDSSNVIRFAAVQWVGEEKLSSHRPTVEAILANSQITPKLLMACLATLSLLAGVPPAEFEKTPPVTQLMKIVADDQRPAALRATALQMVPASTAELSTKLLLQFAKSGDAGLKTQAVRTLQQSGRADGIPLLLEIAADENAETSLRLDAIAGLCATPHDQPLPANIEQLLLDAVNNRLRFRAASEQQQCRLEAIRALRGRATPGSKIGAALIGIRKAASDDRGLVEALDLAIDGKSSSSVHQPLAIDHQPSPDSGRRVFYHHQGPLCFKCHTVNGRGGNVGPDLSVIARTMNREKLLGSILEPSKEISPQFLTWTITTDDGKTHNGIIVTENGGGDVELGDIQGNVTKIPRKTIEERAPSSVSVMPQGLHQRMTSQELSDLLDYLETLK